MLPDLDDIRRHRLLPSDCLAVARAKNPGVTIELVERKRVTTPTSSAYVLEVTTGRGQITYEKGPMENWADVFRRAELL